MTPSATEPRREATTDTTEIRPFQINIPEAELTELRRRITMTRFPEKETVSDFSQGVPLATVEKLARYWALSTSGARSRRGLTRCRISSPRSTVSTSISSTSARRMKMPCVSS